MGKMGTPGANFSQTARQAKSIRIGTWGDGLGRGIMVDSASMDMTYSPSAVIRQGMILYCLGSGSDYRYKPWKPWEQVAGVLLHDAILQDDFNVTQHYEGRLSQVGFFKDAHLYYDTDGAGTIGCLADYAHKTQLINALAGMYNLYAFTLSDVLTSPVLGAATDLTFNKAVNSPPVNPEVHIVVRAS